MQSFCVCQMSLIKGFQSVDNFDSLCGGCAHPDELAKKVFKLKHSLIGDGSCLVRAEIQMRDWVSGCKKDKINNKILV